MAAQGPGMSKITEMALLTIAGLLIVAAMLLVIALSLGLTGCTGASMTPEERGIEVSDRIGVFNQDKALFMAQKAVEDAYGVNLGDMHSDAVVYWADTICPQNGVPAVIYNGKCLYGVMFGLDEMYVAVSVHTPDRTCGTALIHEFGHALHLAVLGDYNGAHDNHEFWDVLDEPIALACARDW